MFDNIFNSLNNKFIGLFRRILLIFSSFAFVFSVIFVLSQLTIGRIVLKFNQLHYLELLKFNLFWVNLLIILWAFIVMVFSLWKFSLNKQIESSSLLVQANWLITIWFSVISANMAWFCGVVYANLYKLFCSADQARDLVFENNFISVIKRWSDSELLSLSNELFRLHSFNSQSVDIFLMIRSSEGSWDSLKCSIEALIQAESSAVVVDEISRSTLLQNWLSDNRLVVGLTVGAVIMIGGLICWYFLGGGSPSESFEDLLDKLPGLPPEPGSLSSQLNAIDSRLSAIESHPAIRIDIPDFIRHINDMGARLAGIETIPASDDLPSQLNAIDSRLSAIESRLVVPEGDVKEWG